MDYYGCYLQAMHTLLRQADEPFWARQIAKDLDLWEQRQSVAAHLARYGEADSLDDLYLQPPARRWSDPGQRTWANVLYTKLRQLCHAAAVAIERGEPVGPPGLVSGLPQVLHGKRCAACGSMRATQYDIDMYIAPRVLAQEIAAKLELGSLEQVVNDCLSMRFPTILPARRRIHDILTCSGIDISERDHFDGTCEHCAGETMAACSWSATQQNRPDGGKIVFTAVRA